MSFVSSGDDDVVEIIDDTREKWAALFSRPASSPGLKRARTASGEIERGEGGDSAGDAPAAVHRPVVRRVSHAPLLKLSADDENSNIDICVVCLKEASMFLTLVLCDGCVRSYCGGCLGDRAPPSHDDAPWSCGSCDLPLPIGAQTAFEALFDSSRNASSAVSQRSGDHSESDFGDASVNSFVDDSELGKTEMRVFRRLLRNEDVVGVPGAEASGAAAAGDNGGSATGVLDAILGAASIAPVENFQRRWRKNILRLIEEPDVDFESATKAIAWDAAPMQAAAAHDTVMASAAGSSSRAADRVEGGVDRPLTIADAWHWAQLLSIARIRPLAPAVRDIVASWAPSSKLAATDCLAICGVHGIEVDRRLTAAAHSYFSGHQLPLPSAIEIAAAREAAKRGENEQAKNEDDGDDIIIISDSDNAEADADDIDSDATVEIQSSQSAADKPPDIQEKNAPPPNEILPPEPAPPIIQPLLPSRVSPPPPSRALPPLQPPPPPPRIFSRPLQPERVVDRSDSGGASSYVEIHLTLRLSIEEAKRFAAAASSARGGAPGVVELVAVTASSSSSALRAAPSAPSNAYGPTKSHQRRGKKSTSVDTAALPPMLCQVPAPPAAATLPPSASLLGIFPLSGIADHLGDGITRALFRFWFHTNRGAGEPTPELLDGSIDQDSEWVAALEAAPGRMAQLRVAFFRTVEELTLIRRMRGDALLSTPLAKLDEAAERVLSGAKIVPGLDCKLLTERLRLLGTGLDYLHDELLRLGASKTETGGGPR